MNVRHLIVPLVLLFALRLSAEDNVYRYRLYLDGKPDSEMVALTERAHQRRDRLSISTDEADRNVSESYLRQLREAGLVILTRSRWLNTAVVMLEDGSAVDEAKWTQFAFVKKVEMLSMPNQKPVDQPLLPTEEGQKTRSKATSDDCTMPLQEVNAYESLYRAGHRGKGMLIAVFDGGFSRLNECSYLMDRVDQVFDFYVPTAPNQVFVGDNHGLQCMSVMACPESEGVCGTAQDARYCLFHTENSNFESAVEEDMWVAAAEMADSLGVDIISSSLGYGNFDGDLLSHSLDELAQDCVFISKGARIASQKGMLVCCSAGNEGKRDWGMILFPSDVKEVLCVGATTIEGEAADFTSRGFLTPYVKPDVVARGKNCYTIRPNDNGFEVRDNASGTSFSTPLIAGLCASLWGAVPDLTPEELRTVVLASASAYDNPTIEMGYGLPDFSVALQKAQQLYPSAIEQIKIEAAASETTASARYYNMMGQPLSAPPAKGMYIDRGRVVTQ